jgi:diguanylate cyclase
MNSLQVVILLMFDTLYQAISVNFLTTFIFFHLFYRYQDLIKYALLKPVLLGIGFGIAQFIYRQYPINEGTSELLIMGGTTFITAAVFGGGIAAYVSTFTALLLQVIFRDQVTMGLIPDILFNFVTATIVTLVFAIVRLSKWQVWTLLHVLFHVNLYFTMQPALSFALERLVIELVGGGMIYYFIYYLHKSDESRKQLENNAITDGLTGLYNTRFFHHVYHKIYEIACHGKVEMCLLLLDIDHFKKINDTYGHPVGDQILVEFAGLLQGFFKEHGIVSRIGGEEFSVLCKDKSWPEMRRLVSDFQALVRAHEFIAGHRAGPFHLTFSGGMAAFAKQTKDAAEFLSIVDEALYRAKRDGRDQVCLVPDVKVMDKELAIS